METERVSENYQPEPGQMDTRTYWIAYPDHVAGYGHQEDRISRACGTGRTRKEALADAERRQKAAQTENDRLEAMRRANDAELHRRNLVRDQENY